MAYINAVKKLINTIKKEASADAISIICCAEEKLYYLSQMDDIIEYVEAVDDVVGIRAYSKDEHTSLGWFGIEPENEELFDVIYDYTDNDYCKKIMNNLK